MNDAAFEVLIAEMRAEQKHFAVYPRLQALIDEVVSVVRRQGYLGSRELTRIAAEKSPRRAGLVESNSDDAIRFVTERAYCGVDDERFRINLLTALEGVRTPMASCILAWAYPERWGVIDRRAWAELHRRGLVDSCPKGDLLSASHWVEYLPIIRAAANAVGKSPQQVDRWLYSRGGGNPQGRQGDAP